MIVTIDGPAGAGKSSVAKALARRLDFRFLDTGAMYRAVALAALERRVAWDDDQGLAELARQVQIAFDGDRVLLDGRDVSRAIRSSQVTAVVRHVADHPQIRASMVDRQRAMARGENLVTEGRDQGTVAFPDAQCKIFLTASPQERARRRWRDLQASGERATLEAVLEQQQQRDKRDATRPVGPLARAADAHDVVTDGLTPEEVVDRLEAIVRQCQTTAPEGDD